MNCGVKLSDLLRHAESLGAICTHPHRTGEVRLRHPLTPKPITMNGRKKDASREAVAWIRRLERTLFVREGRCA